ncbi:hypothetical protein AAVH_09172 [Aphelenchoides avenae]|nr:hypothetical protein AAVH_09172 [Aphelenchus avenae]
MAIFAVSVTTLFGLESAHRADQDRIVDQVHVVVVGTLVGTVVDAAGLVDTIVDAEELLDTVDDGTVLLGVLVDVVVLLDTVTVNAGVLGPLTGTVVRIMPVRFQMDRFWFGCERWLRKP